MLYARLQLAFHRVCDVTMSNSSIWKSCAVCPRKDYKVIVSLTLACICIIELNDKTGVLTEV